MRRDPNCTLCKLHKTAEYVCLLGQGPKQCDVMIVGEAPGKREDDSGKPFVGDAGKLLDDHLSNWGFDRSDVYITNAVHCRPPDNRTPSKSEIKTCNTWLRYEIAMVKPKFILTLGNVPLQSITGKSGITSKRGRPFDQEGIVYLPTFHPAYILRDPSQTDLFDADIRLFREIVDSGEIPRESDLNHRLVTTWRDVDDMIALMVGTISFDIEGNCLYPWQTHNDKGEPDPAKITMFGFGTAKGEFSVPVNHPESPWSRDDIDEILERCETALEDCWLVTQGGKFDFLWIWVHFGRQWYHIHDFDTLLASYILNENDPHGLKELARKHCGAPDWDIDRDKKQGNTTLAKLGVYHGHDLHYTRKLRFILGKMLDKDGDSKRIFNQILMPCSRLFTEVEYDGIHVEIDQFDDAEKYLRGELRKAQRALKRYEPSECFDSKGKSIEFNWGSNQQLADLLYNELGIECPQRTPKGNPSVSESALNQIDHPCVADLIKFRGAKQQLSFFIEGWKPYLHKKFVGGEWHFFLHPSCKIHGTVTGRFSYEHPNLQQVPRDPRIRSLITAPPGWTLVECDLSQIELRIAAELAGERHMLEAFAKRIDVHWLTAIREIERGEGLVDLVLDTARTWKQNKTIGYSDAIDILLEMGPDIAAEINSAWKEYRKKAKAINFGYLYGMWWKKFKIYARDNYGVTVTDEQAQDSRKAFFAMYPDYPKWHDRQKRYARNNGYVRSLAGRKRRLPQAQVYSDTPERREAERQAINSPVQSFANEICLMSMIQLREEFDRDTVRICGAVHDAALFWAKNGSIAKTTRRMLQIMSRPKLMDDFDITISVPIEAEAKIGPWGAGIAFDKWLKRNSHEDAIAREFRK